MWKILFSNTYKMLYLSCINVSIHNSDPHIWKLCGIFGHHEKKMAEVENIIVDVLKIS